MGLNNEILVSLSRLTQNKPLGKVLTLGRVSTCGEILEGSILRELGVSGPTLRKYLRSEYADEILFNVFGATEIDAIDIRTHEGATIIHDLSKHVPPELARRYDSVIDHGTLEHVFNIPMALQNIQRMTRPGGLIFHCLPTDNQCNHGLYQISPELFRLYYAESPSFTKTRIELCAHGSTKNFREIALDRPTPEFSGCKSWRVNLIVSTYKTEADEDSRMSITQESYMAEACQADASRTLRRQGSKEYIRKSMNRIFLVRRIKVMLALYREKLMPRKII